MKPWCLSVFLHKIKKKICQQVLIHPDYDHPNNDLALLHLSQDVKMTEWAYSACRLPPGEIPNVGEKCWINGFETYGT